MNTQDVIVVGAGIGGMTAALCLAQAGMTVAVFERSARISEIGAGIQLSPNATRVLHALGLEPALRAVAFVPEGVELRGYSRGQTITTTALGDAVVHNFGYPYYHIHRADLMQVLLDAARDHPRIRLHTEVVFESLLQTAEIVEARFGARVERASLLVGADGIHSAVRTSLFGAQPAQFTGNVAWRGLVPAARLPAGLVRPVSSAWLGPGGHFVHYYVRAGQLVNCVCVVEKDGWTSESWLERGEHAELKRDFAGWHRDLQTLIDAMDPDSCYRWALFDRAPLPRWSVGRVTLLGDACHATLPFMAQGAAMAIEDAAVLSSLLTLGGAPTWGGASLSESLQRYENLRRPRTSRVQAGSRNNARLFHLSGAQAWQRNRRMAKARAQTAAWLYEYDAWTVAGTGPTG